MSLLTIITITYNAEAYLDRTLKSVDNAIELCQNPDEIEYLIIDGASKDSTLAIAANYSGFISKIVSEKDNGLYDAMNKGLKLATGAYVWFLNAGDEIYNKEVLEKLLIQLRIGTDIYYSDAMFVNETGTEVGLRSKFTPHTLPSDLKWQDFSLGMKVCHQAFIPKRNITPLYDISNLSADIDWEIVCLKNAKSTQQLDFILCKYLLGGISVKNHKKSLKDRFKVLRKHFGLIPTIIAHMQILWRGYWFKKQNGKYW